MKLVSICLVCDLGFEKRNLDLMNTSGSFLSVNVDFLYVDEFDYHCLLTSPNQYKAIVFGFVLEVKTYIVT